MRTLVCELSALAVVALLAASLQAAEPQLVSVSPSSGGSSGGISQNFTFVVSDTDGASDIAGLAILFFNPAAPSGFADQKACWMFYNHANNTLSINSQSNGWSESGPVGGAGSGGPTLYGQLCSVQTPPATATSAGNNLTLTIPVTFQVNLGTWVGNQPVTMPIYMRAVSTARLDTGYQQKGTWAVNPGMNNAPDFYFTVTPAFTHFQGIAVGSSASYTVTVSPINGFTGSVTLSPVDESVWGGGNFPRVDATLTPSTVTVPGSATLKITTSSSTVPALYSFNFSGYSGQLTHGSGVQLAIANAPPSMSMYPYPGTGSSQTFHFTASDHDTADDVKGIHILINSSPTDKGACWMFYDTATNYLWLASDDASSWTKVYFGSSATAQNSQCTVAGVGSVLQNFGQTGLDVNLTIPVTFSGSFSGTKTIYMRATNYAGFDTGFKPVGTWTVP